MAFSPLLAEAMTSRLVGLQVPMDQSKNALHMIDYFIKDKPLASSTAQVEGISQEFSTSAQNAGKSAKPLRISMNEDILTAS